VDVFSFHYSICQPIWWVSTIYKQILGVKLDSLTTSCRCFSSTERVWKTAPLKDWNNTHHPFGTPAPPITWVIVHLFSIYPTCLLCFSIRTISFDLKREYNARPATFPELPAEPDRHLTHTKASRYLKQRRADTVHQYISEPSRFVSLGSMS
jgi:hypothetical protein